MKKPEKPPVKGFSPSDSAKILKVMQNKELMMQLHEIEKKYPYWEKFKYNVRSVSNEPVLLWNLLKLQRAVTSVHLKISHLPGFDFKYNIPGRSLQLLHQFDLNLGGLLEGSSIIPEKQKDRLLISSIMEEAIASSQLEGAVTTREVAKAMLRSNRKPKNHSEKMILNNYLTIQEILRLKDDRLSVDMIKHIHKTISKGTLKQSEYEGVFRSSNEIKVADANGEVFYDPPSHEHLDDLMQSFCDFANSEKDGNFIHPIVRATILHFLIGYIHPFVDGNGRTARAIFYWYLISKGYWLVEFLSISRIIIKSPAQYARAYLHTEYDDNDLTYFIDYKLKSMDLALKSLKEYISRKMGEKRDIYNLLKNGEINERQADIVKEFLNDPNKIISIVELTNKQAVSYQTARNDLQRLENIGYLKSKMIGKKRSYFKSDDFDNLIRKLSK